MFLYLYPPPNTHTTIQVYMFEVIEVVPEPDRPQTNHKLKLVYHKVQKYVVGWR